MRPRAIELVTENADDGPAQFHHQVVPDVPILAADVHSARKCHVTINNGRLDVIAGNEPRVLRLPDIDAGIDFQEFAHGLGRLVVRRQAIVVGACCDNRPEPVQQNPNGDPLVRTPPQPATLFGDCKASLTLDFTDLVAGGTLPFLVPGAVVHLQAWFRDPAHPDGTGVGLTNGARLTVEP